MEKPGHLKGKRKLSSDDGLFISLNTDLIVERLVMGVKY